MIWCDFSPSSGKFHNPNLYSYLEIQGGLVLSNLNCFEPVLKLYWTKLCEPAPQHESQCAHFASSTPALRRAEKSFPLKTQYANFVFVTYYFFKNLTALA